jgi:hypothetical protein
VNLQSDCKLESEVLQFAVWANPRKREVEDDVHIIKGLKSG